MAPRLALAAGFFVARRAVRLHPFTMPRLCVAVVVLLHLWAAPADAGQGFRLLRYVPDEADAVVTVNVAKARSSELFRKVVEIAARSESWTKLANQGVDVVAAVDTFLIAIRRTSAGESRFVAVVEGKIANLQSLIASAARSERDGLVVYEQDDAVLFFHDQKLFVCSAAWFEEVSTTARGKRGSVKSSRRAGPLRMALAALESRAEVWAIMRGAFLGGAALPVDGSLEWLGLTATGSRSVAIEARLGLDTEGAATEFSSWIGTQLPQARQFLKLQGYESMADSIEVKTTGAAAGVSLLMSDGEVARALSLISQQFASDQSTKSP